MRARHRLTDAELEEIRRRRPGVRASLACEGMHLTADEEALFEQMDRERLTGDERAERIRQFARAKRFRVGTSGRSRGRRSSDRPAGLE